MIVKIVLSVVVGYVIGVFYLIYLILKLFFTFENELYFEWCVIP